MALLGVSIRSADGAALRFITALSAFLPSKAREAPVLRLCWRVQLGPAGKRKTGRLERSQVGNGYGAVTPVKSSQWYFFEVLLRRLHLFSLLVCCVLLAACGSDDRNESQPFQQSDVSSGAISPANGDFPPSSELDLSGEGEWGEGERRGDLINYFELNFLTGSEGFAECFIDALASEMQNTYSDLVAIVDFVANNGASEEMLGREVFRAIEAALGGCDGFVGEEDALRVAEIVKVSGSEGEPAPVLLGDEEAGIFYVENWDPAWGEPYFESVGDGPVKVVMSDIFGDDATEEHGDRVRSTFLKFAQRDSFTLFTFDGGSGTSFEAIHTDETVIISASAHDGMDPFVIGDDSFQEVERLKTTNALYLSSLENAGVDGDPELGVYPYPHAGNAYVIENDPDAMEHTLFIAWYWDLSETWGEASSVSSRQGSVDLHGDFVQRNLDHILFVEIPLNYEFADTSHATPIAAARAVELLSQNPEATAKDLKHLLLAETVRADITVGDSYYDDSIGPVTDPDAYVAFSEVMSVNVLPAG